MQVRNKYRELSEEETKIKIKYGKNRYKNIKKRKKRNKN